MTREEFGQKLKELRNRSKLTQTEVADFLGFETKWWDLVGVGVEKVENLWKIIVVALKPLGKTV